nr:putative late blight resistance protein homolog R1B-16 isoform X1 [Ipomoea batatas]
MLLSLLQVALRLEAAPVGIADLFVEEEDLYVEKPQRDTDAEKTTQPCVKLGQVFQTAMEQIEAIKEELLKIKNRDGVEERKTAHDVLQRLEVLKLNYDSYVGKQWELLEDDKFCQLIVLEINSTHLKDWKATGDNFPKLEHLYLFSCTKLKEIPNGFAEISKLKSIQLVDCRPSVVASAEEIKEEQLNYLNNIVDVVVPERRGYSPVSESESLSLMKLSLMKLTCAGRAEGRKLEKRRLEKNG